MFRQVRYGNVTVMYNHVRASARVSGACVHAHVYMRVYEKADTLFSRTLDDTAAVVLGSFERSIIIIPLV